MTDDSYPTELDIRANRLALGDLVVTTPVRRLVDHAVAERLGETAVWLKEELFQRTGSFKPRGALTVMRQLDADALVRGVTGVSAGNHAISLAYCARTLGTTASVVMPRTARSRIASATPTSPCPVIAPVSPRQKSTYSMPSASTNLAPSACSKNTGWVPGHLVIHGIGTPDSRC